jgi:hypothetical protein
MNGTSKISNVSKVIIVAVIAAILIVWVIVSGVQGGNQNAATNITAVTLTEVPSGTATQASEQRIVTFITPVAGDIWIIGEQNPISWNAAPKITGAISLLAAATGKSIGIILPEIGPLQTSYTWNTRDVFLDRSDPQKTDVVPGTYKIEVSFDGNDLKPIISPTFTITN